MFVQCPHCQWSNPNGFGKYRPVPKHNKSPQSVSRMMTSSNGKFSALLAICAGNSPVTGEFPTQRPVTRSLDFFICAWINAWVNNPEAGDLRRRRAHYDVNLMRSHNRENKPWKRYESPWHWYWLVNGPQLILNDSINWLYDTAARIGEIYS